VDVDAVAVLVHREVRVLAGLLGEFPDLGFRDLVERLVARVLAEREVSEGDSILVFRLVLDDVLLLDERPQVVVEVLFGRPRWSASSVTRAPPRASSPSRTRNVVRTASTVFLPRVVIVRNYPYVWSPPLSMFGHTERFRGSKRHWP